MYIMGHILESSGGWLGRLAWGVGGGCCLYTPGRRETENLRNVGKGWESSFLVILRAWLWRGDKTYVHEWEIENGLYYVLDIGNCYNGIITQDGKVSRGRPSPAFLSVLLSWYYHLRREGDPTEAGSCSRVLTF